MAYVCYKLMVDGIYTSRATAVSTFVSHSQLRVSFCIFLIVFRKNQETKVRIHNEVDSLGNSILVRVVPKISRVIHDFTNYKNHLEIANGYLR